MPGLPSVCLDLRIAHCVLSTCKMPIAYVVFEDDPYDDSEQAHGYCTYHAAAVVRKSMRDIMAKHDPPKTTVMIMDELEQALILEDDKLLEKQAIFDKSF